MNDKFWLALLALSLSGCTSLTTLLVADNVCARENVYCGDDSQEERAAAKDIAEEAFRYDKKLYEKITGNSTESSNSNTKIVDVDVIYCKDHEEKVCISTGECKCI